MHHSVGTTAVAVRLWPVFDLAPHCFTEMRVKPGKVRTTGASGLQAYLEGMQYLVDGVWTDGHITLSPYKDEPYFDSAHLTVNGKNYFFDIDASGADPGTAPAKFKGKFSHAGSELPARLQSDLSVILTHLAGTFT